MEYVSHNVHTTIRLGERFAKSLKIGDIVGLDGELGTGKTSFVKGICKHFKVKEIINSPTFVIVNEYTGRDVYNNKVSIFHFDLYRIFSAEELDIIGFKEYLQLKNSITLIEWSKFAAEYLQIQFKTVEFLYGPNKNTRIIIF
ncbi:MAG: tRNA (adenosine(37)-N6)-threonylcarbamoyltransferase complex ATPase subunit type 1 TsaE [Ignavibacteria bacterium]